MFEVLADIVFFGLWAALDVLLFIAVWRLFNSASESEEHESCSDYDERAM